MESWIWACTVSEHPREIPSRSFKKTGCGAFLTIQTVILHFTLEINSYKVVLKKGN